MKKIEKSSIKIIVVMILIAVVVVVVYLQMSKSSDENVESISTATEVQKILDKDLSSEYPVTPREVVKLYCRIMSCFYNEKINDDDMAGLLDQLRLLYDEELLSINSREDHLIQVKGDIVTYERDKVTLSSYIVDNANNVTTWKKENIEFAQVYALFTLKSGFSFPSTCEKFLLRKDQKGFWKIVGWELADKSEMER